MSILSNKLCRQQWNKALDELGLQYGGGNFVCMLHFHPDDISKNSKRFQLRPGAIPSIGNKPNDPL